MRRKQFALLSLCLIIAAAGLLAIKSPLKSRTARPINSHIAPPARVIESYGKLPLSFELNQGQTDPEVKFISRGSGYNLFLTSNEAVLTLKKPGIKNNPQIPQISQMSVPSASALSASSADVLRMKLIGANPSPRVTGLDELPGKSNYFIGNDPAKWRTNVPTYAKVKYENVYPGIDLVYYGNQGRMEYDFVVSPRANPEAIRLNFDGAEKLKTSAEGDVVVRVAGEEIRLRKPLIYQEVEGKRREIAGGYTLEAKSEVRFQIGTYDAAIPITIDPVLGLSYFTYLGSSDFDGGNGVAVDSSGNAYVTGSTYSTNFPTTPGTFEQGVSSHPNANVGMYTFVAKINPSVSGAAGLIYSTYLAGSAGEAGIGIAVDLSGNAYVTGLTYSPDYPVTSTAFQTVFPGTPPTNDSNGHSSSFVSILNSNGNGLLYSTYFGGTQAGFSSGAYAGELGLAIAVDSLGKAYITGTTTSSDFPLTPDAFQELLGNSGGNVFIAIVDAAASGPASLVFSTYLGGSGFTNRIGRAFGDLGNGIALDSSGSIYVVGTTNSRNSDFPAFTAVAPLQPAFAGLSDAFVAKIGGGPNNPIPTISSLSAASQVVGSGSTPLGIDGSNFVTGAHVLWNGSALPTLVLRYTHVETIIPASDLASTGTVDIRVANPAPGGGVSNSLTFTITPANPIPTLTALVPGSTSAGGGAFTLTVSGTNFVAGAVVQWNGATRTTTFVGSTQLTASISAGDIASGGTAQVTVVNPNPGGGPSNSLSFNINNAVPTLTSISPGNAPAGGTGFAISIAGIGFVPGSIVQWNGSNRSTAYFTSTRLSAAITASDIASVGTAQVTVFNPPPGGGLSNAVIFFIGTTPSINSGGTVNAASFSNLPLAAGSIASVFGTSFASSLILASSLPLPRTLGGTSVNSIAAPLFAVSPTQINFQIPWELQGQSQVSIIVTVNGVTSSPVTINLAPFSPGIFTMNQQGTGQGAILAGGTAILTAPVGTTSTSRPARRQEYVTIFCTGLGAVTNQPISGGALPPIPQALTTTMPLVTVGGIPAFVSFSGLAPEFVGLYQVNIQVPPDAPVGDAVPVAINIGGVASNTVTMAVQ